MARYDQVGSHKTTVFTEGGVTKCVYHSTPVVTWSCETIVLNSGGWSTHTTKTRMNQCARQYGLGYQVFQKDYAWYVKFQGETLDFYDGMILTREV